MSKLTINNGKSYILLTGIIIVTPSSDKGCTIKMNGLQKGKSSGKKNPKGPKFFNPSNRSCIAIHSINIQSSRSSASAAPVCPGWPLRARAVSAGGALGERIGAKLSEPLRPLGGWVNPPVSVRALGHGELELIN